MKGIADEKTSTRSSKGRTPVCCQCAKEISGKIVRRDEERRFYCENCEPIEHVQKSWTPLGAGKVTGMFTLESRKAMPVAPRIDQEN